MLQLVDTLQRNWKLVVFAGIAVLASALLVVELNPTPPEAPGDDQVETSAPAYRAFVLRCESPSDLTEKEMADCVMEAEQHRLQRSDLVQQTRAADAAETQAFLAARVAWMVLAGTVFGVLTLGAVILAALYARSAADAAEASLAHSRKTTEDEMRPWLQLEVDPDLLQLEGEHALASCTITLTNIGKLPARVVFAEARIFNFDPEMIEVREYFASVDFCKSQLRTILPTGKVKLLGTTPKLARDRIVISEAEGQAQVHTMLALKVVYQWGDGGEGLTCQTYEMFYGRPDDDGTQRIPVDPEGDTCEDYKVKQMGFDSVS